MFDVSQKMSKPRKNWDILRKLSVKFISSRLKQPIYDYCFLMLSWNHGISTVSCVDVSQIDFKLQIGVQKLMKDLYKVIYISIYIYIYIREMLTFKITR